MAAESGPADRAAASRRATPPRIKGDDWRRCICRAIAGEPIGSGEKGYRHTQAKRRARGQLEPGTSMTDRDDRIREIAYFLWLEEGCPEGAAERHWLAAETRLESDPLERKRIEGEPPGEPKERVPSVTETAGSD
jgi:hypothetical protein